jgi:hypothetical protein
MVQDFIGSGPRAMRLHSLQTGLADRQAGRFQEASGSALPTGRRRISRRASSPPPVGPFPKDLHRRIRPTRPEPDSPRAEPEAARLNFPWAKYGKGLISRGKDG